MLLVLLALAARLLVPAGFMPMTAGGQVLLVPCSGHGPVMMAHGHHHAPDAQDHTDMPCGFSALADVATGGADAVLLVAAVAHVMAAGTAPLLPFTIAAPAHLRPPLRAPPR